MSLVTRSLQTMPEPNSPQTPLSNSTASNPVANVMGSPKLSYSDTVFDYALEDAILECLGKVLSVCLYSSRRDDLEIGEIERVMLEGNLIYSRLHQLCLDQRDLFFKVYNTAKAYKVKGLVSPENHMSYEDALERVNALPNKENLMVGIEFIHNFQDLVKQRLLLVKPLLVHPEETKQVYDTITSFMCYECVFEF